MDTYDRIYLAGFFDGEGCVRPHMAKKMRGGKDAGKECVGIILHVSQKDPEVLHWIRTTVGEGVVVSANRGAVWRYRLTDRAGQMRFIQLIYPYSIVKRQQLKLAYNLLLTQRSGKGGRRLPPGARDKREKIARQWLSVGLEK